LHDFPVVRQSLDWHAGDAESIVPLYVMSPLAILHGRRSHVAGAAWLRHSCSLNAEARAAESRSAPAPYRNPLLELIRRGS
jgi:hypothetical protein